MVVVVVLVVVVLVVVRGICGKSISFGVKAVGARCAAGLKSGESLGSPGLTEKNRKKWKHLFAMPQEIF